MNIEQSKKLSIIDFLDKEGIKPTKVKGNACWYLSPFRSEKTPSFKVSRKENLWWDYAIQEGGDLVELVKRMYGKPSVSEALAVLASKNIANVGKVIKAAIAAKEYTATKMNDIRLLPLRNHALLSYLNSRRVDITIGMMYSVRYTTMLGRSITMASPSATSRTATRCAAPISRGALGTKTLPCLPTLSTSGRRAA